MQLNATAILIMLVCGDAELCFAKALLVRMGKRAGKNKTELCNHVCLELIIALLLPEGGSNMLTSHFPTTIEKQN